MNLQDFQDKYKIKNQATYVKNKSKAERLLRDVKMSDNPVDDIFQLLNMTASLFSIVNGSLLYKQIGDIIIEFANIISQSSMIDRAKYYKDAKDIIRKNLDILDGKNTYSKSDIKKISRLTDCYNALNTLYQYELEDNKR